ncbi:MAG: hypothetical protein NTY47_02510, partial [Candidatus Omnitrophica bacterium]|nr:hypothetical protein [Candidatus Omnitrophota bacterium]
MGRLYYLHGQFDKAIEQLKFCSFKGAEKVLAISYFRNADYAAALEIFNGSETQDEESLYYWGLTCEKLNLFDKALSVYAKIKSPAYQPLA